MALAVLAVMLAAASLAATSCETVAYGAQQAASPDGSGTAAFTTTHLHAGIRESFCLAYTATDTIATNGGIRVVDAHFNGPGWARWQKFQSTNPAAGGYLSVTSTNSDVGLAISRVQKTEFERSYTTIVVSSGELSATDVVTLCFGNARTPERAYQAVEWLTLSDADGDGTFAPIAIQPRLSISPDPTPVLMVATGPTYVQVGAPFTLTVRVLEKYGNPCIDFADTLTFTSTDALADLPPQPSPFPPGSGVRDLEVTFNTPGIQYVYVNTESGEMHTNSNAFVVVDSLAGQPRLFWGDLHGHHGHVYTSTLGQRVDEYMEYGRDVSDLDFACESFKSALYENLAAVQSQVAASVLQYNDPGRFVTFHGYEWSASPKSQGHHVVYFSGPTQGPVYSWLDPASDTLHELWQLLDANMPPGEEAITPPHYLCRNRWHLLGKATLSRRYRPLVELYSGWGSGEMGCLRSARRALACGNRIGFYASSDTHLGLPGNPLPEGWHPVGGLAAVRADALTRDALWQGLKHRRTYATDGERIFLDFTLNGYPMGSEISSTVAPHIAVTAAGTAPITMVEVFRGTYMTECPGAGSIDDYYTTIYSATPGVLTISFDVTDTAFSASAFYYVRVTQADGKRAWSSPIWVDLHMLTNASFEEDGQIPAPWRGRNLTLNDGRVCNVAQDGSCSFRMVGTSARKSLTQVVNISGSAGDSFTLSAWSRAKNPSPTGGAYCLLARVFHTDATKKGYRTCFAKSTHGWQSRERTFTVAKDYNKIIVFLIYARQSGKAWFDDVRLVPH